jgi:two-component system LytT family response regulator
MPHAFHVLIVDDENQSRALIRKLLADHFPNFIVEEAATVEEAREKINTIQPQLVFLDVQMRNETGFDLLDQLGKRELAIIFTTAHSEFAVKAFRYSAIDYLLKPIDAEEFVSAVQKAKQQLLHNTAITNGQVEFLQNIVSANNTLPDKLTIPTAEGFILIPVDDILYCRAMSNYTEFYLKQREKIVSSYTLGYYEELLANRHFFRAHRSYLVNLGHIKMYKRGDGGTITMSDGEEIEVSRNNKEAFLQLFKGRN